MREHFESAGLAAPLALRLLEALDA
jgi:hypothetical protein